MAKKDYYEILGLEKGASKEDRRKNSIFSVTLFQRINIKY